MMKKEFIQYQQEDRNMEMLVQISEGIEQMIFSDGRWIS